MKKILLIDDDQLVAATLVEGLRRQGYDVQAAYTGKEGMALAEQYVPDLVLLDLRLPDLSGVEVANVFQSTETPFVVLSAYDDPEALRCTTEYGALCYLVKPIALKQLIPVVEASMVRANELSRLRINDKRLRDTFDTGIVVATATGIFMERYVQDRASAYERIRHDARTSRAKVRDCAAAIVTEVEDRSALGKV